MDFSGSLRPAPLLFPLRIRAVPGNQSSLHRIGEEVNTPNGLATVIVGHRLKETVSVRYSDDDVLEWSLAAVTRKLPSKN